VKNEKIGFLFLIPSLILLAGLGIFPIVYTLKTSLYYYPLSKPYIGKIFVGLGNYLTALKDPLFRESIYLTVFFVVIAVSLEFLLGISLALFLNWKNLYGRKFYRVIFLLPMFLAPTAIGITFRLMLHPDFGIVNYFLSLVGIKSVSWLGHPRNAMMSLIVADVWNWTPFMMILSLAGLQALPDELLEAAKIDGASAWKSFFYITIPFLKPIFFIQLLFRGIDAYRLFDTVYVLTGGGPGHSTELISMYIYRRGFNYLYVGYGSAMAIILLIIVVIFTLLLTRKRRESFNPFL